MIVRRYLSLLIISLPIVLSAGDYIQSYAISPPRSAICDHKLPGPSGIFYSPGWPNQFQNDMTCLYRVEVPKEKEILVYFSDVQFQGLSTCVDSYIKVFGPQDKVSQPIRQICQNGPSGFINYRTNSMLIEFKAKENADSLSFRALYDTVTNFSAPCNQYLKGNSGNFKSLFGPNVFPRNTKCSWTIESDPHSKISLKFTNFDLQNSSNCNIDSVIIYDGLGGRAPSLGNFCGNKLPNSVESTGNKMHVVFKTGNSGSSNGFAVEYAAVPIPTTKPGKASTIQSTSAATVLLCILLSGRALFF